jgi:hypothetical protein
MDPNLLAVFLLVADIVVILALRAMFGKVKSEPCYTNTSLAPLAFWPITQKLKECHKTEVIITDARAALAKLQKSL